MQSFWNTGFSNIEEVRSAIAITIFDRGALSQINRRRCVGCRLTALATLAPAAHKGYE